MPNVWVIGGLTGIGKALSDFIIHNGYYQVVTTGEEVDVCSKPKLGEFIITNAPFDIVIYCAGIKRLANIPSLSQMDLASEFNVNVIGFINTMTVLTQNQNGGKMVCVVSTAADIPMRHSIGYCSSKAALKMAVKCCARELAPDWSVVGVSPHIVDGTPMTEDCDEAIQAMCGLTKEEAMEYELKLIPMNRRTTQFEVAKFICHVMEMSPYLTGSVIDFAGGRL